MRPLTSVSKSPAKLAQALAERGHEVCRNTVDKLLETRLEYSRQFNRKTHEGTSHKDRDAQFEHINARVTAAQAAGEPVISVDTKKKEVDRQLQERRFGLSAEGRSDRRESPRL